jgi:hypothetical protein
MNSFLLIIILIRRLFPNVQMLGMSWLSAHCALISGNLGHNCAHGRALLPIRIEVNEQRLVLAVF